MPITHFLSLPCPDAIETVTMIQRALLEKDRRLQPHCKACPPARSHISLLMLDLSAPGMLKSERAQSI